MSKSQPALKLHRLVGAVNFRPTLRYFHNIGDIAAGFEDEFAEWSAPGDGSIVLNSPSERKDIRITPKGLTYYNENEVAFEKAESDVTKEAVSYLTRLFEEVVKTFSVEQIQRVGFQITQILELPFTFPDLADLIYRKFYTSEQAIREISCDKLRDVAFVLDAVKNGYSNHVSIGPVNGLEAMKRVRPLYPKSAQTSISACNLYIDVDVSLDSDLTTSNAIDKVKRAVAENIRILAAYKQYLDL